MGLIDKMREAWKADKEKIIPEGEPILALAPNTSAEYRQPIRVEAVRGIYNLTPHKLTLRVQNGLVMVQMGETK